MLQEYTIKTYCIKYYKFAKLSSKPDVAYLQKYSVQQCHFLEFKFTSVNA